MPTGEDLIKAIEKNDNLLGIKDCPGVPARLGYAMYGDWQDDTGEVVIRYTEDQETADNIKTLLQVPNTVSYAHTAVWHFMIGPPVHHFVVVPWYRFNTKPGWVYTVFMAFESTSVLNAYTLGEYIKGGGNAPTGSGYRTLWERNELGLMLYQLLRYGSVWKKYFGGVNDYAPNKLTCWKYPFITLDQGIQSVNSYKLT